MVGILNSNVSILFILHEKESCLGKQYSNPPIIEALCEFRFGGGHWDIAIPGIMSERLKDRFPVRKQGREVTFGIEASEASFQPQFTAEDRLHLLTRDEKTIVQVGTHFLAINRLKPYVSWPDFTEYVYEGLDTYLDIAKPRTVNRIGLRYINRIEFDVENVSLHQYFTIYPKIGIESLNPIRAFTLNIESPYEGRRDMLRVQLSTQPEQAVMFDMDYFLAVPGRVSIDNISSWIENAHNHVEAVFESTITDNLRETFK
jgi:uncharacterized protein (TIGR04255 family)